MPIDSALIEAVLAPIAGDNPSGKDLRYDPRYDQVKEARREDMELPEGGLATERKLADWPTAAKLARKLLETETKDLQLAAWLTEALLKQHGLAGLATGAAVAKGILEKFWDTCYPAFDEEDPELRAGPLDWMGTKFEIPVRQAPVAPGGVSFLDYEISRGVPSQSEADANAEKRKTRTRMLGEGKRAPEEVDKSIAEEGKSFYKVLVADADAAAAAVTALEKESDSRFGTVAPSFGKVRGVLDSIKRLAGTILAEKLIADPDPVEEVAAAEAEGAAAGDQTVLSVEPVSPADAANRVGVAARFLRKLDPTNPAPYLMLRGLRWGELRASAATELDPKLLEAPPTALRTRLRGLALDGKWAELLEACEVVMATPQGRGWLDLQRYVLTACDNLGSAHDRVARAVRDELRLVLTVVPQLPRMTLMDDLPTANPETVSWLAASGIAGARAARDDEEAQPASSVVLREAIGEDYATGAFGGLRPGPYRRGRDPFAVARAELGQGRASQAIEMLLGEAARERSPRGRFVRQTQVAWLMVESGMDAIARPILDRLVATIDERKLEDWESGPLVAQPLALIVRIIDRSPNPAGNRNDLYLRICRLDPVQAMALQTKT